MPKYLYTFEKSEAVRWLGHLDILRTFERAIRRAQLPIAFSSGFNPRERLSFANALSTGVTGALEPAMLELTEPLPPDEIVRRLNEALPPGIRLHACELVPDAGSKDLLNAYDRAEYTVICGCSAEMTDEAAQAAIEKLLALPEITLVRERQGRTKTLDIRPYVHTLNLSPDGRTSNRAMFETVVALGESGNAKPTEVIQTLAGFLPGLTARRTHRVRLIERILPSTPLMISEDD